MIRIHLYRFLLCCFLLGIALSIDVKPDNSKNLVKIKVDDKNRTYYHLKKDDLLEYTLSDKGIDKSLEKHSLKLIARTLDFTSSGINTSIQSLKTMMTLNTDTISLKQTLADYMYEQKEYPF